jgi:Amj-like protein
MLESNGMDSGLLVICALTFVIHLIGTLAYSVRIAGTRTRRIALSLSLFNVLVLISRTSNSFQAPLLAKRVETNIAAGVAGGLNDFRWLLASATAATVLGAVLIPTFQRLLTRWVTSLEADRSPLRTFRRLTSPAVAAHIRESVVLPRWTNVTSPISVVHDRRCGRRQGTGAPLPAIGCRPDRNAAGRNHARAGDSGPRCTVDSGSGRMVVTHAKRSVHGRAYASPIN